MTPRVLAEVEEHLREATDRVSELLATLSAERSTVACEMLIDAARMHAGAILDQIWLARWQLPPALDCDDLDPTDPQRMNLADWAQEDGNG